jgi:hypothetical protein
MRRRFFMASLTAAHALQAAMQSACSLIFQEIRAASFDHLIGE